MGDDDTKLGSEHPRLKRFWKSVYGLDGRPTARQLVDLLADDGQPVDVRDDAAMDLGD